MDSTAIDHLMGLLGVQTDYYDFRGEHRLVPPSARRDILAAMGISSEDPDSVSEAIQTIELDDWQRLLPPVIVIGASGEHEILLHVRESDLESRLHWRLWCEDGRLLTGHVRPALLQRLGERTIGEHKWIRCKAALPDDLDPGYHELAIHAPGRSEAWVCRVIVVPATCHEQQTLQHGERHWGLSVQLYALRSERNWGIGDFGDLKRLAWKAGRRGAHMIGLNPLHALFPADPVQFSPYRPSNRSFLNILYIDVPAIEEATDCAALERLVRDTGFAARLESLRAAEHVDYHGVTEAKLSALRLLFEDFRKRHIARDTKRAQQFQSFVKEAGPALETHALFEALHAHFGRRNNGSSGWHDWPSEYRDPCSDAVMRFALRHREAIDFHQYLQWIADLQLTEAQSAAREAGMSIGLYRDLAVGVSPEGSEAWSNQQLFAAGATVGAPPDALALKGQDWGLPPLDPGRLRRQAFAEFSQLIRSNMRHCGALRIDHVMGLLRLWWVPQGSDATEGAYVYYPYRDLLGIVALESQREDCLVIGEDLGTVPDEIRQSLPGAAVYSYRVLMFEKNDDGSFRRPAEFPRRALATVSTHDLPPLHSYWDGSDIDLRERLGLYPDEQTIHHARASRQYDKSALLQALQQQQLCEHTGETIDDNLVVAIHQYLARSDAALVTAQPEDWLGMTEPVNVPGTSTALFPNWRRKLVQDIDGMLDHPTAHRLFAAMSEERS
ncbi:MAG: 4-alpha-glucanotransferase [Gammaproteobacteria bacterium]|nr:4-alpha-glucanotransferase [Gammaproteobacteria bacterium]